MIELSTVVFYALAGLIILGAAAVLLLPNPIHAALSLAVTMISLGFLYIQLEAYFIASVQLIVYAGAVMVLFVMVLMLFDLKKESASIGGGAIGVFLKVACGLGLTGFLAWAIKKSIEPSIEKKALATAQEQMDSVKMLAGKLFTQYVFAFEALGVLLLVVAVGVVAVSRTRGGTHARD